ncbi:MAG: Wzz/FepE/Etk N-terminal domain-containing protein, partial [Ruminococcus sp.]|nr:Wzz/FepE/Etk N-terminal domain-containing protein [Ruminococcus sp.]
MNENHTIENKAMIEIDIKRIIGAVWHKIWIVCLSAILCAIISLTGTVFLVTPTYQSSAMFYVNNNSLSVGDASFSLTSSDITAAKSLVDTYIVILKSRACLNEVIDYAELDLSYSELRNMISAAAVNSTEIFEIVVTSPDPDQAEKIANAIAYILPKRISSIVEGTSANIVDYAVKASNPSSPSYSKNTLLGLIAGILVSVAIISVREVFDITIRSDEDVERCCNHPILTSVPDMTVPSSKSGYYYGYGNNKKASTGTTSANTRSPIIGKNISFAASEAYKLLRTKLQFSFVDEITCPIIGVSSAMAGEGKSLSSINLAFSLAQLDKKVLLIDCDMRRPSVEVKLRLKKIPGLSNYLTGQNTMSEVTQLYQTDSDDCFDVIAAGVNPPN